MEKVFLNNSDCCGCTACMSICPKNAITMEYDYMGFLYPSINQEQCVNCKQCINVCSFIKPNNNRITTDAFVIKHKDLSVLKESRSGGAFTALSDIILQKNGVIYGATLDEKMFIHHTRAETKQERDLQRKSKYVQSNLNSVFLEVENDLENDRWVMFTGVGCQCDGLLSFLKNKKNKIEKLLICDIVCHSGSSPILFKRYLEYQENKHRSKITDYDFRDKNEHRWQEHVEKIAFDDGKVYYTNEFTNLFFSDNIRPSCFKCKYCSLKRCSDLTLADCWGGDKIYPDLVNETGASLVLVNTEKGKTFIEKLNSCVEIRKIEINDVMQPRLSKPEEMSNQYETFWEDYKNMQFDSFIRRYSKNDYTLLGKTKKRINNINSKIKRGIKKLGKILS